MTAFALLLATTPAPAAPDLGPSPVGKSPLPDVTYDRSSPINQDRAMAREEMERLNLVGLTDDEKTARFGLMVLIPVVIILAAAALLRSA